MELPPLADLVYLIDDGDHVGGGHCIDLPADDDNGRWVLLVGQYQAALKALLDEARADREATGGGWAISRPVLFVAHHTFEVAIKAAVLGTGAALPKVHGLQALWATLIENCPNGLGYSPEEAAWVAEFLATMASVTPLGLDGRYADTPIGECGVA